MRVLNDYKCEKCDNVQERYIDSTITTIECPVCTRTMHKVMVAPRPVLDGTDPNFTAAYDRWARVREQRARIHAKQNS